MRYGNIKQFSIENGEGVRVSLFVSGCRHHCKGCFQAQTWDFSFGNEFTKEVENKLIAMLKHERIDGLTILGGEPLEPENQPTVLALIERVRKELPNKTIWLYTGSILGKNKKLNKNHLDGITDKILSKIDVLVDGPFIEQKKNLALSFRGSTNQRILYKDKDF